MPDLLPNGSAAQKSRILLAAIDSFALASPTWRELVGLAPIVGAFTAGLILEPVHYEHLAAKQGDITIENSLLPLSGSSSLFFCDHGRE